MEDLFYKFELIFVLVASAMSFLNTFATGCELIKTVGKYNMAMGIVTIILSITVTVLAIAYYQFYKLLD